MPTALTNIETFLPLDKLQQVVQHYGCPPSYFVDGTLIGGSPYYNKAVTGCRFWYVHLFTGRVPTPAEFYYGLYIDRVGDTVSAAAMLLSERHLGTFLVGSAKNPSVAVESSGLVGSTLMAHGSRAPDEVTFSLTKMELGRVNQSPEPLSPPVCPPSPLSNTAWALDWSFSPASPLALLYGSRAGLRPLNVAGKLAHGGFPTWFWVSSSASLPATSALRTVDYSKVDNAYRARIEQLRDVDVLTTDAAKAELERRPLLLGTVGPAGSGADLELAVGYSPVPDVVRPLALRARLVAAPTAG